ncbi:MAG: ADP-ribosylglycohydrolase family protein [Cyanobacteria bacterium RU_5_0]|nr:ADP-ribosylglycohydrolase family protein [Cyanobacteria bacterium RU_5_0]
MVSSRFRGALLGAALGEILGANYQNRIDAKLSTCWLEVEQWGFASVNQIGWGQLAIDTLDRLVQNQPVLAQDAILNQFETEPPLAGWAIATLPIALFHHDDPDKLRFHLEQAIGKLPASASALGALIVGYTLSLALREQFHPHSLIPRLQTDLEIKSHHPRLAHQLNQVQTWMAQTVGITAVKSLLRDNPVDPVDDLTPIALALYSFLSTPTEARLSILRAIQLQYQPPVTGAIAGALSGAYRSFTGLPLNWRRGLGQFSSAFPLSQLWSLPSEADLLHYADRLWAVWSGAANPADWLQHPHFHTITASPHLIRPC